MIEVRLIDLVKAKDALSRLYDQKLPINLSKQIFKFIKKVNIELNEYKEIFMKQCKDFGEESSPGKYSVLPENMESFKKSIEDLDNTIVKFEFNKFTLPNNVEISSSDIELLEPFINLEEGA